jgi:hypothetical protein
MTDSLDKLRAEANAPTDDRWIEVRNRLADEGFKPAPRKEERVETDAKDLTQYRKDNLTALEKVTATAYNPLRGAFEVALELVATPLEAAGQLTTIDSLRSAAGGVRGIAAINEDKMLAPDGSRLVEPGLGTKFAEAGGSMLGFGLGGSLMGVASRRFGTAALGLGQATRMSKGVDLALGTSMKGHAARLGAITQAQSMFRDAEAAGASKGMQYAAFFLGLPVGAVEGIGIGATGPTAKLGGIMAKIDKRSGGALGKAILAMPIIIKEGATEAAQEGFQTFSEKMIAQQILQYATPEEWDEIWAAVGENAMIGGVLGSGLAQIGLTMENRGIKKAKAALIAGAEKDLGRMVLDSAAEVSLGMDSNKDATGAPRTQASPEEAVARFAESAGIEGGLDFEVVDPEKALDPEAEIPTGEVDLYGRLNNIVGQGGQLPPIVTVDDANAPPGAYVDGVVIINKTFQNEMLAGIALHEILHTKARAGSEEFGRLVAEAQEAFPALTLRMALMYEDAFIRGERESKWYKDAKKRIEESKTLSAEAKEAALEQLEAETRPFAALPDGPERTALLIEEGFAHATQHMSLLVDEFISNPESIKPEDVAELKTVLQRIAEWLRNALAKINIGAGGKRSQALAKLDSLLKDQVKRTTQAGAKPEEVVAMAQALARVMREAKIETLPAAPKKGSPDWWRSALPSTPLLPAGPKVERIAERASEREPVIPLGSESRSSRLGRTKAAQAVNAQGEPIPLPSESLDTKGRRYRDEVAKMEQEVAAEGDPIKRRKPAPEVEPVKKKPTPPRPVTEAEAKGGPPLKAEARRQRYEAHLAKLREERGQTKKPDRARRDAGPTAAEAAIEDFERGGDRLATLTEKPTAPKKAVRPDIDEKLTPAQPKADATQAATKATATDTKKPTVAEMPRTKPDMFGETKERNATRREVVEDAGLQGQLIQEDTGQRGQASILDEEFQTEPGRIRPAGEEPIPAGREERVYRISTGAQGKMYTLRVTMLEADGNGVLVPREHYVRNLGTDWTRAVRRALKAARGQDVFGTEFTIDEINRQDAGLLKSGRYRGQSIEDVAAKDPGYIDWLWTSGTIQSKANELVLRHAAEVGVYPSAEALAMVEAATKKSQNYAKYYQQLGETPSEGIAAVHAAFAPVRRADMLREKQASNIYFEALRERKAGTREWHDPRVKPKKIKLDDVQDIAPNPEVTFGKHKGKSIEDVIKRSPKYYEWLKSSGALDGHPALRAYIDQRDQGPKSEAKPKEKPSAATVKAERSLRGRDQLRKKIREVAASDHSTFIHWLRAVGGVSNSGGDLSNFKIKENPAMRRGLPPGFPAAIQPEGKGMSPDMLVRMMIEDGWFAGYTGDTREIEEQLYETENDTDTINRFLEENPTRAEIQEGYVEPDMDPREAEAYQNLKDKGYPRNVADEIMAGEHWGVTPQSAFEDTAPDYSLEMEPPETFFPSDPAIEAIEDFEDFEDTAPDYSLEMEPPETFFPSDPAIENFERGIDRFATALSRSDAKAILLDIETGRGRIDALVERKPTIRQESIESIRMRHGDRPTFYQYVAPKSGDEVKSAAGVSSASTTLDGAMLVADGTPALIFTPGDAFARSPRLRMYSEPVERVVADVSSLSVSAAAKLGSKAIQTDRAGMISVATLVDTALSEQEVRVDLTGASAVADIPLDALHQAALSILRGNRWISLRGFIDEMRDTYRAHFGLDGGSLTPKAGAESEEADALMRSVLPFVRTPNPSPNIRFATAPTIEIDGQERHRMNSDGKLIAGTDEALRNFWRWFGDSVVVDDQGRPLVVYHGTARPGFDSFQTPSWFTTDADTASGYSRVRTGRDGASIYPVYLSLKNPAEVDGTVSRYATSGDRSRLEAQGHDGMVFYAKANPILGSAAQRILVPFSPTQIKSATGNRGTFSPTDPDIRRATGYHGSPYDFDRFDMSKIGTGEGRQAFGYGLYLADQQDIAAGYKKAHARKGTPVWLKSRLLRSPLEVTPSSAAESAAWNAMHKAAKVYQPGTSDHRRFAVDLTEFLRPLDLRKEAISIIRNFKGKLPYKVEPEGFGYTVELAPKEDEWLLWDKPLKGQSALVLKGLANSDWYADAEGHLDGQIDDPTGADLIHWLERNMSPREASKRLRAAGVRGTKYLDGTSRRKGTGTYNYVIFDAQDAKIVDRWATAPDEVADIAQEGDDSMRSIQFDRLSRMTVARRAFQDFFLPVRQLQKALEAEAGAEMPDEMNVSRAQRNYYGRLAEVLRVTREKVEAELVGILGEDITLEEAHDYALAKHAPEANAYIYKQGLEAQQAYEELEAWKEAKRKWEAYNRDVADGVAVRRERPAKPGKKPAGPDPDWMRKKKGGGQEAILWHPEANPASSVRSSVATKLVNEVESGPLADRYKRLNAFLRRQSRKRIKILRESGEMSPALEEAIAKTGFKHYVPLVHEMKRRGKPKLGMAKGFQSTGPGIKRRGGRKSAPDNVVMNTVRAVEDALFKAEKKRVVDTMRKLIEAFPDKNFWNIYDVPVKVKMDQDGIMREHWEMREDWREDAIQFYDGEGKGRTAKVIVFNDKAQALSRAFKGGNVEESGAIMKAMRAYVRYQSAINTSLNIEFALFTNFVKDLQTAGLVLAEAQGWDAVKVISKRTPSAIRGIYRSQRGKPSEWTPLWDRLRKAGGKTGYFHARGIEEIQADMEKAIRKALAKPEGLRKGIDYAASVLEFINELNEAVENGVRLSAFKYAVEVLGMSDAKAAELAKTLTIDFNTRGEQRWLSGMYMFSNAGLQGTARMMASGVTTKRGRKISASIMLLFAMLDQLNYWLSGDDDDGRNRWDARPEHEKDRYLQIYTGVGESGFFSLPMPYGYSFFATSGRTLSAMARTAAGRGETDVLQGFANTASSAMSSFSPVGDAHDFSYQSALRLLSPTITDPLVELAVNQDWKGSKIYAGDNDFDRTPGPRSEAGRDYTADVWKQTARLMNSLTGGDRFSSGLVDVHPETLKYLVGTGLGGTMRVFNNALDAGTLAADGDLSAAAARAPFVRHLFKEESARKGYYDFYANSQEVLVLADLHESYSGSKDPDDKAKGAELYKDEKAVIDLARKLKVLEKRRKRMQDRIKTTDDDDKRATLEAALYAELRAFNRDFQQAKKQ